LRSTDHFLLNKTLESNKQHLRFWFKSHHQNWLCSTWHVTQNLWFEKIHSKISQQCFQLSTAESLILHCTGLSEAAL